MRRSLRISIACLAVSLLAACAPSALARRSVMTSPPPSAGAPIAHSEILLDAQLGAEGCGATTTVPIGGFARMKVRDRDDGGGEVEYEMSIDNPQRLRLTEAVVALNRLPVEGEKDRSANLVLWSGETSDKQRVRMRGILPLPPGISTSQVAAALRERRGALTLRIAGETGALAGCGDLRN